jgi:hypothetical protein
MSQHISRLIVLAFSLIASFALIPAAEAQADHRCVPETNHCTSGRIREYWEQNGGLPVFGFPTTDQHEELVEGQPFQIQWFERNRLELHPENQRPYDVLLGRLGADRLQQQGRDWFTFPKGGEQSSCRHFAETTHTLCGAFLDYFRVHGLEFDGQRGVSEAESLALFGLPISEAVDEVSPTDGKTYQTQWFERARFELHLENQPPYNVLLGLLGNEIRSGEPSAAPPAPAALNLDGEWKGKTGQGRDLSFTIAGNTLTRLKLEAKAGDCTLTITSDYTRAKHIEGNTFSESSRAGESSYNLTGTFHSDTTASGTLKMTNRGSHCNLDVDTTWEATRQ